MVVAANELLFLARYDRRLWISFFFPVMRGYDGRLSFAVTFSGGGGGGRSNILTALATGVATEVWRSRGDGAGVTRL